MAGHLGTESGTGSSPEEASRTELALGTVLHCGAGAGLRAGLRVGLRLLSSQSSWQRPQHPIRARGTRFFTCTYPCVVAQNLISLGWAGRLPSQRREVGKGFELPVGVVQGRPAGRSKPWGGGSQAAQD